jgi:hypothetical protein
LRVDRERESPSKQRQIRDGGCLSREYVAMTPSTARTSPRFLGAEFDPFLFAPVGCDRSGAPLSVVSALARLDLDAWAEAAALARLPTDVAVGKLAGMLRKFTEIPQIAQDPTGISARLVALLPDRALPRISVGARPAGIVTGSRAASIAILLAVGLMLGAQLYQASQRPVAAAAHPTQPVSAPP